MNENERINETNLNKTVNGQETVEVIPAENDTPALPTNTETDLNAVVPEQTEAAASVTDPAAAPETFFDRVLDILYAAWDAILDLMVALHILEEALPEQEQLGAALSADTNTSSGIFPVTFAPDAATVPLAGTSAPITVAG